MSELAPVSGKVLYCADIQKALSLLHFSSEKNSLFLLFFMK